jgi:hypothetical protein
MFLADNIQFPAVNHPKALSHQKELKFIENEFGYFRVLGTNIHHGDIRICRNRAGDFIRGLNQRCK